MIVERNLDLQRKILADRQKELARAIQAARDIGRKASEARRAFGDSFPDLIGREPIWSEAATEIGAIDNLIASARDFVDRYGPRIEAALATKKLQAALAGTARSATRKPANVPATQQMSASERSRRVDAVLARLDEGASPQDLEKLAAYAAEVAAMTGEGRFAAGHVELQLRIQVLNKARRAALADARRARALLSKLDGFAGDEVAALRRELHRVMDLEIGLAPRLAQQIPAVAMAQKTKADAEYAARVLAEEFARLGYAIGPAFDVALVEGGQLRMTRAELGEYQVLISGKGGGRPFHSELTRGFENDDGSDRRNQRDAHMQSQWCADLGKALTHAAARGVRGAVLQRTAAGAKPVRLDENAARGRAAAAAHAMQLPNDKGS